MITQFKIGQKVKFVSPCWKYFHGKMGIVIKISNSKFRPITVELATPIDHFLMRAYSWECDASELALLSDKEENAINAELATRRHEMIRNIIAN